MKKKTVKPNQFKVQDSTYNLCCAALSPLFQISFVVRMIIHCINLQRQGICGIQHSSTSLAHCIWKMNSFYLNTSSIDFDTKWYSTGTSFLSLRIFNDSKWRPDQFLVKLNCWPWKLCHISMLLQQNRPVILQNLIYHSAYS